jgi:hypothetical protein
LYQLPMLTLPPNSFQIAGYISSKDAGTAYTRTGPESFPSF